jgi:hypothetical protein
MDIFEIIRRWHAKQAISQISEALEYDRKTIRKYIQSAKAKGITPGKELVFSHQRQILFPKEEHENDVPEGARRATGVTSFFRRFPTSFATPFS